MQGSPVGRGKNMGKGQKLLLGAVNRSKDWGLLGAGKGSGEGERQPVGQGGPWQGSKHIEGEY